MGRKSESVTIVLYSADKGPWTERFSIAEVFPAILSSLTFLPLCSTAHQLINPRHTCVGFTVVVLCFCVCVCVYLHYKGEGWVYTAYFVGVTHSVGYLSYASLLEEQWTVAYS